VQRCLLSRRRMEAVSFKLTAGSRTQSEAHTMDNVLMALGALSVPGLMYWNETGRKQRSRMKSKRKRKRRPSPCARERALIEPTCRRRVPRESGAPCVSRVSRRHGKARMADDQIRKGRGDIQSMRSIEKLEHEVQGSLFGFALDTEQVESRISSA
jgi:hypothetical protein